MNILCIDDDDMMLKFYGEILSKNHFMAGSHSATKCQEIIGAMDVVICDWDLGMHDSRNGGEIVAEFKIQWPKVRYIVCSGLEREIPEGIEFKLKDNFDWLNEL